jgi:undecaprenyl pyrophosphate phosphatase UppP
MEKETPNKRKLFFTGFIYAGIPYAIIMSLFDWFDSGMVNWIKILISFLLFGTIMGFLAMRQKKKTKQ